MTRLKRYVDEVFAGVDDFVANRVKELSNIDDKTVIELTADIVSAYVGNNPLPASGLPDLIASVSASVRKLAGAAVVESPSLVPVAAALHVAPPAAPVP